MARVKVIKVPVSPPVLPPGNITPAEWVPVKDAANLAAEYIPVAAARIYDVEAFGAVRGRGMSEAQRTANTAAFNAAAQAAFNDGGGSWPTHDTSLGTVVIKGEYEVDPGIVFACNVDAANACLFVYNATNATPAVFVGTTDNVNLWGLQLSLPKIRKFPSGHNGAVGLELANLVDCDIQIPEVAYFQVNVRLSAYESRGNVSNRIRIGTLMDGKIGVDLRPRTTTSWVNENKFFGGHFGINASTYGVDQTDFYHIHMVAPSGGHFVNNNVFYAPNLEGATPYYVVAITRGGWNAIHDARWERPGGAPARIYCSQSETRNNVFTFGYNSWAVEVVQANGASGNFMFSPWSMVHAGQASTGSFSATGSIVGRYRVTDALGNLIGYLPVYDTVS